MKISDVINILAKEKTTNPVENTPTPVEWEWVDGFKVVRHDLTAITNDFKYETNFIYEVPEESLIFGKCGFHFFENSSGIKFVYSPGFRIFKVKALVKKDRERYNYSKQVAAKIILIEELTCEEYRKIYSLPIPFVNNEEDYKEFVSFPTKANDDWFYSKAARVINEHTDLSESFAMILAVDLAKELIKTGDFYSRYEKEINKIITIYQEPGLSKEMATYLIIKRALD